MFESVVSANSEMTTVKLQRVVSLRCRKVESSDVCILFTANRRHCFTVLIFSPKSCCDSICRSFMIVSALFCIRCIQYTVTEFIRDTVSRIVSYFTNVSSSDKLSNTLYENRADFFYHGFSYVMKIVAVKRVV